MPDSAKVKSRPTKARTSANLILRGLQRDDYQRIEPYLEMTSLEQKQLVWAPNVPIKTVYFPIDAIVSILSDTREGIVEVGTVGNEGVVGLPVFLGAQTFAGRAIVQMPGTALRMDSAVFQRESQRGSLQELLRLYTLGFMTAVAQGAACNRAHSAEQRLARWLLVVRDRVGGNEFPLTQEFMGQMLGVRRATVSETAAALQQQRLISYRRGVITIEDASGLERTACECYRIVRDEFDRLLGVRVG